MSTIWLSDSACWILVIVAALVIEAVSLKLNAVWFAIGCLCGLVAASLGMSIPTQWIVFLIVSTIFLLLVRPFARRVLKPKGAATNADGILGSRRLSHGRSTIRRPQARSR